MKTQYFKHYSPALSKDMECKVYGHGGHPVIFIPCQNGQYLDFENFKMDQYWSPWIDTGKVTVFSINTMDIETYSDKQGDARKRLERHEQWIRYITQEFAPFIEKTMNEMNGTTGHVGIGVFGCSLGATHASNLFFRFPFIFDKCLSLSGIHTATLSFGGHMDDLIYENSPDLYLANMPKDHPYIEQYNKNQGIICVGRGAWEVPDKTERIGQICRDKGINVWVDLWGPDSKHDWDWWYKQVEYFLPFLYN